MEKDSTRGRNLVIAVGGPLNAGENRKSWLSRVAVIADVSYRVAAAAFYGEQMGKETELKLKLRAGEHESEVLAGRLDELARQLPLRPDFDVATVDALRHASHRLRMLGRSGGPAAACFLLLAVQFVV